MSEKCKAYFNRAIDCFMKDEDAEFRERLFEYVKKECSGSETVSFDGNSGPLLRRVLLKRMSEFSVLFRPRS
jgi:hypothetical protein